MHIWSDEQKVFLREQYPKHSRKELLVLLNDRFGLNIKMNQLVAGLKNHKITSGRNGHFEKESIPVNKGKKYPGKVSATSFKKGQKPLNYKPVGTERIDEDGYILIKVSDEGAWHERWRHKHKVVWEKENGPIPKGHCILFLDGDKQNLSLDNLTLITRAQLTRLNQNCLISNHAELTKTGIIIADIYCKIGERKKAE